MSSYLWSICKLAIPSVYARVSGHQTIVFISIQFSFNHAIAMWLDIFHRSIIISKYALRSIWSDFCVWVWLSCMRVKMKSFGNNLFDYLIIWQHLKTIIIIIISISIIKHHKSNANKINSRLHTSPNRMCSAIKQHNLVMRSSKWLSMSISQIFHFNMVWYIDRYCQYKAFMNCEY